MKVFYHPGFAAPLGNHIMPIGKFALVAKALTGTPGIDLVEPEPITENDLLRVHTREYIQAVKTGEPRELAESQKFPWSSALFPSVQLTNGGVLAAARSALREGVAGALVSGFHHASSAHGEGFCTFNGLVVAAEALRSEGSIQSAAVLDMDLHYGNGTALLAGDRPWLRALSIYGNDYWENTPFRDVTTRHHQDGPNHFSVPIVPQPRGDGPHLLALVEKNLPWLIQEKTPDVLFYQAGADPLKGDPYSPLSLGADDLRARDKAVFEFAKAHKIPIVWVLAGGYSKDIQVIVDVHVNTAEVALEVFSPGASC